MSLLPEVLKTKVIDFILIREPIQSSIIYCININNNNKTQKYLSKKLSLFKHVMTLIYFYLTY